MAENSATTPETTRYIPPAREACAEAAHRLTVVIGILTDHEGRSTDDDPENDPEGYDIATAIELLQGIRAQLRASAGEAL